MVIPGPLVQLDHSRDSLLRERAIYVVLVSNNSSTVHGNMGPTGATVVLQPPPTNTYSTMDYVWPMLTLTWAMCGNVCLNTAHV